MSDTTPPPPITEAVVTDSPEEIVRPQVQEPDTDTPPDPEPQDRAEAVRSRLRFFQQGRGGAASEPSAGPSTPRPSRQRDIPPKPREGQLVKPLTELYVSIGAVLAPVDPVCSVAFMTNAEECAKRLETLARENEAVRRAILALTQTSAWGGVLIAHLPILMVVLMHHGPDSVREKAAPMAMMLNPEAMRLAAEQQAQQSGDSAA